MWRGGATALCLLFLVIIPSSKSKDVDLTSKRDWKPPGGWDKQFPYYISGFDKTGLPILVLEYGRWDVRSKVLEGAAGAANIEAYFDQAGQNLVNIGREFEAEGGFSLIVDFEGFSYLMLADAQTTLLLLRTTGKYVPEWSKYINVGFGVNVNFATQQLFNLLGPIVGQTLAKSELFGSNKARWIPKLVSEFPKSQLPPWYGGSEDWKPLQVLGRGVPVDFEMLKREKVKFDKEHNIQTASSLVI